MPGKGASSPTGWGGFNKEAVGDDASPSGKGAEYTMGYMTVVLIIVLFVIAIGLIVSGDE